MKKRNSQKCHARKKFTQKFCPIVLAAIASLFPAAVPEANADLVGSRYMNVTGDSPNPWTQRIGQGKNTPLWDPEILTVNADGTIDVTNSTAISLGDNVSIIVNGLVHARNNSGGGTYGTGANVVETNSNTSIVVNEGGSIIKEGSQNQAEAINVHGFANQISNYGLIQASNSAAIWFQDVDYSGGGAAQRNVVSNYGTIERVGGGNVIGTSGGNGIIFYNQTGATVVGNLSFAQGNDDLYFYANSSVTGSIDGGGGENRLFLAGAAGSSDELKNTLSHFQTITKTGEGQWTISGSIKGTTASPVRSVRVEEGTLRLTGNNENFTGDLSINTNEDGSVGSHPDAVLEARAQSLPTNTTGNTTNIKNYGTLRFVNDDTGTYVGQIIGTGKVEMTGSGTVVLAPQAGSNTYEGGTYVKNGTLGISADSALGAVSGPLVLGDGTNIGTLQFQGSFNLDSSRSISLIGGGGAFDTNGFNTTISQAFASPSDNLYKKGAGTLTLTSDSSLLGSTYIQEGTLQLGAGGTTGSVGGVYVNISEDAALAYNHSNDITDSMNIIGAGRVIQRGTGTLELTGQYTATTPFTGGTEIETGKILISDAEAYNKTTGTANNAGHFLYASNGSGTTRTIEVDSTVDELTNHVHVASGTSNILQINGDLEISGVTNNSPDRQTGGAIYVAGGAALDLNVGQAGQSNIDLTFKNNQYGSTANDIYLDSSGTLNLNVSGAGGTSSGNAVFIDSGIGGQGTISVNGPGLVQISKNSQAEQTIVSKSTMRLVDGISYTSSYDQDSQSSLQGTGTIDGSITIAGTISPDKATFEPGSDIVAAADRIGKLALVGGDTKLDSGFTYEYDVTAANTSKDPVQTQNDLVQFGSQTVTIVDGTIDFRTAELSNGKHAALETGRYLLFDSPGATYVDEDGNPLTDLNSGVFTTLINGSSFIYPSPRRALQYEFDNQNGNPANSQIWLDYLVNSLTMDWTGGATGNPVGGTWNDTLENWNSQQLVDGNLHERVFMDGDKVHLYNNTATAIAINITEDATVSGMVAGRSSGNSTFVGDVTITGTGGITADAASAFGIYLPGGNGTPKLTPTGKLELFGSYDNNTTPETLMTLTLANTGKNEFLEGIDIYGGKLALSGKADRLGRYAATTGNAGLVTFKTPSDPEVQKHVVEVNLAQTLQNRFVVEGGVNNAFIIANANTTISGITDTDGAIELLDNSKLTLQANGTSQIVLTGNEVDVKIGAAQLIVAGTGNTFVKSGIIGEVDSWLFKNDAGTLQIEADSNADHTVLSGGIFRVVDGITFGNNPVSPSRTVSTSFTVASTGTAAGAGTIKTNQLDIRGLISPDKLNAADATAGSRYGTLTFEVADSGSTITMSGFALNFNVTAPTKINGLPNPEPYQTDLLVLNGAVVGTDATGFDGTVNFLTETGGLARGDYRVIVSSNGFNLGNIAHTDLDGILNPAGALKATINGYNASSLVGSPRGTMQFAYRTDGTTGTVDDNEIWLVVETNSLTMDWYGTGSPGDPGGGHWVYGNDIMQSEQVVLSRYERQFMDGDKVHISNPKMGDADEITVTLEAPGPRPMNVTVSGLVVGQNSAGTDGHGNVTIDGSGSITAYAGSAFGDYLPPPVGNMAPILTPTGILQKFGTGTLTVENTGGNRFEFGTELNDGKIVIGNQTALDETNEFGTLNGHVRFTGNAVDRRTVEVADTVDSINNHFRVLSGSENQNTFRNLGALDISGVTNNVLPPIVVDPDNPDYSKGGVFYVDTNMGLTIDVQGDLTLSGNSYRPTPTGDSTANDIYLMTGSTLNVNVADGTGMFVNSGINGDGDWRSVLINGSGAVKDGFLQISANSSASQTRVQSGRLRLVDNSAGGPTTYDHTYSFLLSSGASLEGKGTIHVGGSHELAGTVSPDSAVFTSGTNTVDDTKKIGALHFLGGSVGFGGFTFQYDVVAANTSKDPNDTLNDLIQFGSQDVFVLGGTVNFRTATGSGSLDTGNYLVIDSTAATFMNRDGIGLADNAALNAVLKGQIDGTAFDQLSPRTWYEFYFDKQTDTSADKSQIWLGATLNSLTMDWTGGSAIWNTTSSNFTSLQKSDAPLEVAEKVFRNGDFVYFMNSDATTPITVTLNDAVTVSGMVGGTNSIGAVGATGEVIIAGTGGITARLPKTDGTETDIIGKFLGDTLIPTGYLDKYGTGTLTFTNTGGNTFTQGIDINEGTVGFNRADQLLVGTGKKITFQGSFMKPATLRADATTDLNTAVHVYEKKFGWLHAGRDTAGQEIAMLVRAAVSAEVEPLSILYKTGAGIVQISAESTEFRATTMVMEGTFRVTDGVTYGDETKAQIFFSPEANTETTLAGSGIIAGQFFGIGENAGFAENNRSVISPDKANLTVDNLTISEDDKFGTLTLRSDGNGIVYFYSDPDEPNNTQDGFWFDYDVNAPNTTNIPDDTTNDLLVLDGMSNVRLHGGVVNFRTGADGLGSGDYLIIDSNVTIKDGTDKDFKDGHLTQDGVYLDGINDYATNGGVLWGKINGEDIRTGSPRRELGFELRNKTQNEVVMADSQIWLTVDRNTLTMVRTRGGVWNSTARDVAWISEQKNEVTGEKEYVIERGDYARIYNPTADSEFTISLGADQIVSGLELGGDSGTGVYGLGDVIIDGDFKITAVTTDDWIEGVYVGLNPSAPEVPVDGRLTKTGDNTVTIANTGGNSFEQGTLIKQGTIVVGHEKALGTFVHSYSADGTATFDGTDKEKTVSIAANVASVKNRFIVNGTNNTLENNGDVEISDINSGTFGGAIYLTGDAATDLTIDAKGGNFTFKNNTENNPNNAMNDIRVDGDSTLNLTGEHHIFLNSGISGVADDGNDPTVDITGTGDARTQVGQSNNFNGMTTISSGGLRVKDAHTYGGTKNISVTVQGTSAATASLEGAGTVLTNEFTAGAYSVISPDRYDLSDPTTIDANQVGTLTIQGTDSGTSTATLDGFTMDYDTVAPNNTNNNPIGTPNDLLQFTDMSTVEITSGTINFRGQLTSGDYLIVDANTSIGTGGKPIDGIDDPDGVLKASYEGNTISNSTPRSTSQFELRDFLAENSQIWYTVERNTLTMDRTVGGKFSDLNFVSRQVEPPTGGSGAPAYGFQHGDATFLTNNGAAYTVDVDTIDTTRNATVVSHFEVDGSGDITLTGNAVLATTDYAGIEGKFLIGELGEPKVPVDGKFVKRGDGTFMFRNAANIFEEGMFLYGGTTAFNQAEQLGDGDHGINFEADATLRADTTTLIYNTINISDTKTATLETAVEDAVWTYAGQMNGGPTSAFDKIGAGTLDLRRAPEDDPHVAFSGKATVSAGTLGVYADYRNVTQFTVKDKATLTGSGILGATADGGVIQSGGTLTPRGYTSGDPNVTFLTVNGALTFDAGSNFDVTISQNPNDVTDGIMAPVSDYVKVDGVVTIDSAANLNVTFDYWNSELTINDFNAEQSSKFTVIDATDGIAENEAAQFTLNPSEILPRGVKLVQGWQNYENGWMDFGNGWLYQLWFEDDSDNNFENICDRHNRVEIGSVLDDLVWSKDPGMKDLIDHLSDPSLSDKEVCDILDWIHGDIGPNSMMMALKKPWRHPFNRLDFGQFQACDPCGPTMAKNRQKRQLWGEFLARYDDVQSDRNAHPFTVNRFGVAVGVDQRLSKRLIVGANFQYSDPRLRQETGKTEMDDYEIGFYGLAKLNDRWEMKLYAGYSHQRYDIDRRVYIPAAGNFAALNERFRSKTDGDAFSASVELIRPMRFGRNMRLLPLIALDIEKAWMDGYRETGGLTALVYDNSSLERIMMRFGMQAEFNVRNNLDLQARIQYATQLNSTEYPRTRVSFANATDSKTADIWGSRIGRDYLNLGVGADWKLNRKRSLSLFVNYDVDLYNRATVHAGEAGIVRQW